MVKPAGERASAPDGATEQRILDAAHGVFVRRGTSGARMQEIADEAGVNKALLHYYFRSKERLAEAVFRRVALQLMPPLFELLASDVPLEDKVRRVVEHEIDHLSKSPFVPGYLIAELSQHPERARQLITSIAGAPPEAIRDRVFGTLRAQIDERVRAQSMRPIDPVQLVIHLISLCIFPFAARPMLMTMLGIDERGFQKLIAQRRVELPPFFLAGLRP
jgi:TetR/AcrR family transcriptional regulator